MKLKESFRTFCIKCKILNKTKGEGGVDSVSFNWENIAGMFTVVSICLAATYGLVVVPLQDDILRHEIRIQALEISDARTGAHLENLTKSIDQLIKTIEGGREWK